MSSSAWKRREDNTYGEGRSPFGPCGTYWQANDNGEEQVGRDDGCDSPACYRVPAGDGTYQRVCLVHKPAHLFFVPFMGQQTKLWMAGERWVLGGGGAGGAKSYLGQRLFLKQLAGEQERFRRGEIRRSKGHALFLRRTIPEASQAIKEFLGYYLDIDPNARWDGEQNICTFSCGYQVRFGGMKDKDDWTRYWGHEYTLVVMDEASTFTKEQIEKLDLRIRTTDPVLATQLQLYFLTNPVGGETKRWLRRRFVRKAEPETPILVKTKLADGRVVIDRQVYIPCNIFDNPALMADGKYEANLRRKGINLMRALLMNDWDVDEGTWIGDDWNPEIHVCDPFEIPRSWEKYKSLDYGFTARTSVLWFAVGPQQESVCYRSASWTGKTAAEVAMSIKQIESQPLTWRKPDGTTLRITDVEWDKATDTSNVPGTADRSIWSKQGEGHTSRGEILDNAGCAFEPGRSDSTARQDAADEIRTRLRHMVADPFDDAKMVPAMRFFSTCKTRIKDKDGNADETGPLITIPACMFDEKNPDVWDTDDDDHDIDALKEFVLSRPMAGSDEDKEPAEVIELMAYRETAAANRNIEW